MTRFSAFTDEELDAMESAFCNEGLKSLVYEVRREREYRESRKREALNKAQTRVWCYMNKEDIDYYFDAYKLSVIGNNGKKKARPNRSEKEQALIEYLTDKIANQSDAVTEKQQNAYEERCKHDIERITGKGIS